MLDAVVQGRSVIESFKTLYGTNSLTAEEWKKIIQVKEILEPSFELTVKMQRKDVMLSELHKYWLECLIKLKKISKLNLPQLSRHENPLRCR